MESTHDPQTNRSWLSVHYRALCLYIPWAFLPLGFFLLLNARSPAPPASTTPNPPPEGGREFVQLNIRAISLTDDEQYLDVVQNDATWRRLDAHTGRELWREKLTGISLRRFAIRSSDITTAGMTSDSRLIVLRGTEVLWNDRLPEQEPCENIESVAICPNRDAVAAISGSGSLWILEFDDSKVLGIKRFDLEGPLDLVSWSPSGDRLAIVTLDRELVVWNTAESRIAGQLSATEAGCRLAQWSRDGRRLISHGLEKSVQVWDAETLTKVSDLNLSSQLVLAVNLSPDGRRAAVSEGDQIGVWNLDSPSEEYPLVGHEAAVTHLCFDHSGTTLFSIDNKHRIVRWSMLDGRMIWNVP